MGDRNEGAQRDIRMDLKRLSSALIARINEIISIIIAPSQFASHIYRFQSTKRERERETGEGEVASEV